MMRLALSIAGAAGLASGLAALPTAASAQSSALGEIVVYGNDPCPRAADDEVVVCVRRPETERYRITEDFRTSGTRQEREAWSNKARSLMSAGNTGINSCSAVGPGGHTGCLLQEIQENKAANREAQQADTPPDL